MAQQTLEGTWEEIAARAEELRGKQVRLVVEPATLEADITAKPLEVPVVGPPNEGMRAALAEIRERQKGQRQTLGDGVAIVRHARTGPLYGREPVED